MKTFFKKQLLCALSQPLCLLPQILGLAFLREVRDGQRDGVKVFEQTKTVLRSVDERGWERTLKVARIVNTCTTFENPMSFFSDKYSFYCVAGLGETVQTPFRHCLEAKMSIDESCHFVDAARYNRGGIDFDKAFLRPLPILLGRYDMKNKTHKELTRKLSECSVDPRVLSQMVSLPLSRDGMFALIE